MASGVVIKGYGPKYADRAINVFLAMKPSRVMPTVAACHGRAAFSSKDASCTIILCVAHSLQRYPESGFFFEEGHPPPGFNIRRLYRVGGGVPLGWRAGPTHPPSQGGGPDQTDPGAKQGQNFPPAHFAGYFWHFLKNSNKCETGILFLPNRCKIFRPGHVALSRESVTWTQDVGGWVGPDSPSCLHIEPPPRFNPPEHPTPPRTARQTRKSKKSGEGV